MRKLAILSASLLSIAMVTACKTTTPPPAGSSSSSSVASLASVSSSWTWDGIMQKGQHEAIIKTNKGDITVALDADLAPKTVTNFMALAASGYYDALTFHRVIPGFMIQGGDPNGNGTGGRSIFGETFEDEIKSDAPAYKTGYVPGVIAMANRGPNTNGSQFFIMDAANPLPPNYTIFGHVTAGQDVVKAIANVPRGANDLPTEPVTFSVRVVN